MTTKHIDMDLGEALESLQTSEQPHAFVSNVAAEAASEITRLQALVASEQEHLRDTMQALAAQKAQVDALAGALKEIADDEWNNQFWVRKLAKETLVNAGR